MWGRFPALLGFMQLAEAEPTMTDTVVAGMQKFAECMNDMLTANYTGTHFYLVFMYCTLPLVSCRAPLPPALALYLTAKTRQ